jgi:hypothetical protein
MTVECLPSNSTALQGVRCDDNARGTLTIVSQTVPKVNKNKTLKCVIRVIIRADYRILHCDSQHY